MTAIGYITVWVVVALWFSLGSMVLAAYAGEAILISRDDFDTPFLPKTDWITIFSTGANIFVDTANSWLTLETQPNTGVGTAVIRGTRRFSVLNDTLIFKSRIIDAYVDGSGNCCIYGDAQPRGLAEGTNRDNAIEFVNAFPVPNSVACRTVAGGTVTETVVDIRQSVRLPSVYQIIATAGGGRVDFYINGKRVATHTTNIPRVPLNVYFSTGDSGAGNVPMTVEYVSFERPPLGR
jgi:hypothetical protein